MSENPYEPPKEYPPPQPISGIRAIQLGCYVIGTLLIAIPLMVNAYSILTGR